MAIQYKYNPISGDFDLVYIPNLENFIPYTGADKNINLGINNFIVDTNSLFVDSVNHRIGIGTTSPTTQLEINSNITGVPTNLLVRHTGIGAGDQSAYIDVRAENVAKFRGYDAGGTQRFNFGYDANLGSGTLASLGYGNNASIVIDSSNNIGLGTATPTYKLDIKGTTATSGTSSQAGYNIETVAAPVAPTFTLNTGGNVDTGNHNYRITYTTAIGETNMGGALTATVTTGNNTVNLTIPISTDPRVTGRKIYRNKIGQTVDVGYLIATIPNNTATTYTDTVADSTLTGDQWSPYRINSTSRY